MLKKYLKGKNKSEFARNIGITRQQLDNILKDKSPKTQVKTCMAIKQLTGLEPYEYLKGLEEYKELTRGERQ